MVGDPAGGDTFEDCLNKCLCKNAFVKIKKDNIDTNEKWNNYTWHDDTSLDIEKRDNTKEIPCLISDFDGPHLDECLCVYKIPELKELYAKTFTEGDSPGVIYRELYEKIEKAMKIPEGCDVDPRLTHDGVHYLILPSFFYTLQGLQDIDFHLIIRTFGTDGPEIAAAINAWSEGKHPLFPQDINKPSNIFFPSSSLWEGRFNQETGQYSLKPDPRITSSDNVGSNELNEDGAVKLMESTKCLMFQDDYFWWKNNGYNPSAGKPLWITHQDDRFHPIFFDDNIHNDANDSIVSVRERQTSEDPYSPLSGESIRRLQGLYLVRVPTFEAILDQNWFLDKITQCEQKLQTSGAQIE
eukprot:CAMPEP_0114333264 /NCGR_PEP_ID=MMETSP0101-20121206/3654_1 /TAXON_ID=38822 ORGANISM="Pteridomonas danica, Strain PT" /NCGR_SAMPLE_ID=MMETSP0101 /ASSEMBLY_ACC=CAM_ASM_000211 /LENGTH=353 /DNA_ID=CAMNT_0001464255 /DNA_START=41 /DNA_END=1102 /DNA_ORIENTATION=-